MPAALPLGIGVVSGIVKGVKSAHQNHLANNVVVPDATYNVSPYAKAMLATANQYKNAPMIGEESARQNIAGNQSNAAAAIERNSNSGAQSLQMISAAQGNTDKAYNDLQGRQAQYGMAMLNNWNNASQGMVNEGDKVYQDEVRKRQEAIGEKNALRGAANQNFGNGMNDVLNGVYASSNAGLFGGDGNNNNSGNGQVGASNKPRSGYNYTPYDEQLPH